MKATAALGAMLTLLGGVAAAQSDLPPRRKAALLAWLQSGVYQQTYTGEQPHDSRTAHGPKVRTWYNSILVEDLRAGSPGFRRGAAMVKELLSSDGERTVGWAVMRKLRARSGPTGRGWLFYETIDGTNAGVIRGRGHPICTGCHRAGADYLLSPFRP